MNNKFIILQNIVGITKNIYIISNKFPSHEIYALTSQLRRALVSIRLNLIEGSAYYDKRKYSMYNIALGSIFETQECLRIAVELEYVSEKDISESMEVLEHSKAQLIKLIKNKVAS